MAADDWLEDGRSLEQIKDDTGLPKFTQKTIQTLELIENGAKPIIALQVANRKENICPSTVTKIKDKYRRWSLTRPAMVKQAHNVMAMVLNGNPQLEEYTQEDGTKKIKEVYPSIPARIDVAKQVYDRIEPKQAEQSNNTAQTTNNILVDQATADRIRAYLQAPLDV